MCIFAAIVLTKTLQIATKAKGTFKGTCTYVVPQLIKIEVVIK